MERRVVSTADRVTMVSEAMVALYRERYPRLDPARFVFLPNGFDPSDWERARPSGEGAPGRFLLLHAGQLAHRPTVRTLLTAVRVLFERDPGARGVLTVLFLGGNEEVGTRERERYGLGDALAFAPSRDHIASLEQMARAGALLLLGHGGAADALLYTGKLYEYLSSGRPILGILDEGPAAALIRSARAGVVRKPGDVEGIVATLRDWLAAFRAGQDLSTRVPDELLASWERQKGAAQAAKALSEITS
jgi:glycosyltransferase involved in cell wall biosynthesis